jgi:hypothetical protein
MKFKSLFLALFVCCLATSGTYGQMTLANRYQIGITTSTDIGYRTLEIQNADQYTQGIADDRESYEAPALGFTVSGQITKRFPGNFGIGLGLQYAKRCYKSVHNELTYGDMIDPRKGFIYDTDTSVPVAITLVYHFNYVDMPIQLNYFIGKRKIKGVVSLGGSLNYLVNDRTCILKTMADGSKATSKSERLSDFRPFNFTPQLSAGVEWSLNDKSSIRVEPIARYGVMKIADTPITEYLWSYGLNIGYHFKL